MTEKFRNKTHYFYYAMAGSLSLLTIYLCPLVDLICKRSDSDFINTYSMNYWLLQNSCFAIGSIFLLFSSYQSSSLPRAHQKHLARMIAISAALALCFEWTWQFLSFVTTAFKQHIPLWDLFHGVDWFTFENFYVYGPLLITLFIASACRSIIKPSIFIDHDLKKSSGIYGNAAFATSEDFEKDDRYVPSNGLPQGLDDDNKILYLPLLNKLTLAPPGTGKTVASSIPALLTHTGPVLVLDIKGELWAVTARYRAEILKRKVVVLDPFGITETSSFNKDKPPSLHTKYTFNPLDWFPEEPLLRDRILTAFAEALIVREGGYSTHFDENAKILIRGYLDYLIQQPKEDRHLGMLYQLMINEPNVTTEILARMARYVGRAQAAANQIERVGKDERGSIFSTTFRQIDWLGDRNIQLMLSQSNFDLQEFLQGQMDIYVVLPSDQIKEQGRLFRMLLSLLMSMIVQAEPEQLPTQKILFLLEELAQLGYCPDVEQAIEVLRSRGVVIWAVFQSLKQIELFAKPDLFKGMAIKQIMTIDDTQTMQWIQTLGGQKNGIG